MAFEELDVVLEPVPAVLLQPGPRDRAPTFDPEADLPFILATLVLVVASACVTTKSSTSAVDDGSPWLKPSPQLRAQIEDAAKRLPWTHQLDRVDLISWFARVGEPAYPTLLQMVLDPHEKPYAIWRLEPLGRNPK